MRFVPLDALARHVGSLRDLLDAEELARAAAIRHPRRALQFMAGRALAKLMLATLAEPGAGPSTLRIVTDKAGKPHVAASAAAVSIAHTEGVLGVAVKPAGSIGLDLEPFGEGLPAPLAEHLHPAERRILLSLSPPDCGPAFLRFWTVKEAVAKCRGTGAGTDFAAINASPALATTAPFRIGPLDAVAQTALLADGLRYSAAVAWTRAG